MNNRPILFSGPMVRALLDGRKTQTRRVLKPQPDLRGLVSFGTVLAGQRCVAYRAEIEAGTLRLPCAPGDLLWVREAFGFGSRPHPIHGSVDGVEYRADEVLIEAPDLIDLHTPKTPDGFCYGDVMGDGWRPSIHMPRWASRLTLRVTDVRVQRVQEISEGDAKAEGVEPFGGRDAEYEALHARISFEALWDSLNARRGYGWGANPWVAAYTFEVIRQNVDEVAA